MTTFWTQSCYCVVLLVSVGNGTRQGGGCSAEMEESSEQRKTVGAAGSAEVKFRHLFIFQLEIRGSL